MERVSEFALSQSVNAIVTSLCKAELGVNFRELVPVQGAHQYNVRSTVSVNCTDTVHVILY